MTEHVDRPTWRDRLALAACRAGLHFLTWSDQRDGYVCACGRNFLWAEQISSNRTDPPPTLAYVEQSFAGSLVTDWRRDRDIYGDVRELFPGLAPVDILLRALAGVAPPPAREIRCGAGVVDLLKTYATQPVGPGDPHWTPYDHLYGVPIVVDEGMSGGAWECREDGRVVASGDLAPGYDLVQLIEGVGLVGFNTREAGL